MRIWHLDTVGSKDAVDGVASGLWVLAEAQAALGHDVTLFVRTEPDDAARRSADKAGLRLVRIARSLRSPALAAAPFRQRDVPDVYHFHGAWMPYHAFVSTWLRHRHRPYVVTTHGGYGPEVLGSKRRRRAVYLRLLERPHLCGGGAAVTTVQGEDLFVLQVTGPKCHIVNAPWPAYRNGTPAPWAPDFDHPTAVFLGRFEVHQKGLDRLDRIAALCPGITFELYGLAAPDDERELKRLMAAAPPNLRFNPPVHGEAKKEVLRRATLYIQPSRFEGFALAVADALHAGTPVVASEHLGLTRELVACSAGGALPADALEAAAYLQRVVSDHDGLAAWSAAGREFAVPRFDAKASALAYLDIYADVIARRARSRSVSWSRPRAATASPPSRQAGSPPSWLRVGWAWPSWREIRATWQRIREIGPKSAKR
ncbi:MAG TPA: glycosyltransferase family 4 protein [Acidimicrobiales bacterium]|nr:glycosyltransferase family 4 protein [Acidimicrobiales bacterium]